MNTKQKISKGTIIRTTVLFITLLNSILMVFGKQMLPIGESDVEGAVNAVYAAISAVAVVIASIVTWWKNNSFTKAAIAADKRKKELQRRW